MVLRIFSSQRLALLLLLLTALQLSGCAVSPRLKPSDQPSVAGKTFVITGASSGFGRGLPLCKATWCWRPAEPKNWLRRYARQEGRHS